LFTAHKITPNIGAEIVGLHLSADLPPRVCEKLYQYWLDYKLLVFRDQDLSPDQQLGFTRLFGEVDKYPFLEGLPEHPLVAPVLKLAHETINFGGIWHSDTSYLECPAAGASLYAVEIPEIGGDTIFCNMAAAFRALPEEMQARLDGLCAINISSNPAVAATRIDRASNANSNTKKRVYRQKHPVIRRHPETGEKILYVNQAHTESIDGLSMTESEDLLSQLFEQARQPEFQCRLKWGPGTLVLWDNRSTQHYPVNDYHGFKRLLHRVSLKGERPA